MVSIYCVFNQEGRCVDRIYATEETKGAYPLPEGFTIVADETTEIQEVQEDPVEHELKNARKKLAFYQEMLARIGAENTVLGLTTQQIQAVVQLLAEVKAAGEVGMTSTALGILRGITPTAEYTQERKDAHISLFEQFLVTL